MTPQSQLPEFIFADGSRLSVPSASLETLWSLFAALSDGTPVSVVAHRDPATSKESREAGLRELTQLSEEDDDYYS
ncbi:hypothetical protein OWM54_43065 [Myxococcus sp. MISCRS1]|uniref:hypothetical protein n=1 Tax=Myxococcus sp. MISCRS1 TaxID=2996786 RepID=UPI00226EFCF3|nr:hypothetical protein [Myxococcus sp. MISCRS1]MCY1003947.1 hypothetical protein [Myxococcus sp. MISCRS1]